MSTDVFVFPLSFAQERLWFMDQFLPGNPLFNLSFAIRLQNPPDVDVLERSLNEIVRRHETLRTKFLIVDERPVQVVASTMHLELPVLELSDLPRARLESEVLRLANEEARRPFDLTRGPLLRTSLLRLSAEEYVFLVTMHHIVSDGWSMGVFWTELSAIWSAFALGKSSPLSKLPIQYGDFAVWQRQWLKGDVLDAQLKFWKQELKDIPVLELQTDRPRPAVQTFGGATVRAALPVRLSTALRELSQREGATLFMTLLAGFQILLQRYTGQEDIVVGSYIAGRNRAEIEGLIGFFLNSIVLRSDLSGDPTFRELLGRVRKAALAAYAHQDVPFAKLVEELQPERNLSRNPLFQVMFQMLNIPTLSRYSSRAAAPLIDVQRGTAVFDISCMFEETAETLNYHLEYNTDLFDATTIERMARHFETLLESIAVNPNGHLSELQMLPAAELRRLLVEWNTTAESDTHDLSIVKLFETRAARHPEAIAFLYEGQELSYGELNSRANQVAHHLRALGVGTEVIVGICLERSFEFVIGLMGVLKAGGAFLTLDPSYPPERLATMFKDSRVSVLLTRTRFASMFSNSSTKIVCIDADNESLVRREVSNPTSSVEPRHLAYIIYTSGSTGRPKAVASEHRQILNRFAWMWETYPFVPGEVCCQKTALNFIDSIWELLGPLLQGVCSIIIPDEAIKDPHALVERLADAGVTRIWVVPSLLRLLLDTFARPEEHVPNLKFWVTSGEALSVELMERFRKHMPNCILLNIYGTSEVWDATCFDSREQGNVSGRVPIGRPIRNVQVYVLDPELRPVPIGVAGELYVGGPGLARGYLDRPDATSEKFIESPLSSCPSTRLYRTGDRARWLADGNLDFLGRTDHQIKIRGFRVEPDEVEWNLRQHELISDSVVIAREDSPGDQRLVAYIVVPENGAPLTSELRNFLRGKLPEHMIPTVFVRVKSLPLTPSGKVDRIRLPTPGDEHLKEQRGYAIPRNDIEWRIAGIWQEVLRVDQVGINDNFFDLGGHSLLLIQVFTKLRRLFEKQFSVTDLFRYPTVSSLGSYFSLEGQERPSLASRARKRSGTGARHNKSQAEISR